LRTTETEIKYKGDNEGTRERGKERKRKEKKRLKIVNVHKKRRVNYFCEAASHREGKIIT
jgi:hypothetical protein